MINSIIEAISTALDAEFNASSEVYEIHMVEIKQGLEEPCFFIACLNPTTELFLGKRYFKSNSFCIQYFPKSPKDKMRECNEVAERMNWCLEYIIVNGDKFRGTKMKYEIVNGVLNFFVNYDCFIYKVGETTMMGEMVSDTSVKEGD